jgi:hypothetical protein
MLVLGFGEAPLRRACAVPLTAILLLHRSSGVVTLKAGSAEEHGRQHGFDMLPAIIDGDECFTLERERDWVATAQPVVV